AVERLERRSPDRTVRWDPGRAQVEVRADWDRLGQVLDNLLINADRFSPAGAPIRIEVDTDQLGLVGVRVCDQGPGVAPEVRPRPARRPSGRSRMSPTTWCSWTSGCPLSTAGASSPASSPGASPR